MNYESQFIESQWKHAISHMKMPAVQDSATSLICEKIPLKVYPSDSSSTADTAIL